VLYNFERTAFKNPRADDLASSGFHAFTFYANMNPLKYRDWCQKMSHQERLTRLERRRFINVKPVFTSGLGPAGQVAPFSHDDWSNDFDILKLLHLSSRSPLAGEPEITISCMPPAENKN
jgi:hypothetical protein